MNKGQLIDLAGRTLSDPRAAAGQIMDMRPTTETLILAVALVAILSTILQTLGGLLTGITNGVPMGFIVVGPVMAVVLGIVQVLVVATIAWLAGRFLGGRGTFTDALALMVWLQFLITGLSAVQLVAFLVLPALTVLISLAVGVLSLWLMTNFTAALHGLDGLFRVFGMIILASLGVALCVVFLMSAFGVELPTPTGAV